MPSPSLSRAAGGAPPRIGLCDVLDQVAGLDQACLVEGQREQDAGTHAQASCSATGEAWQALAGQPEDAAALGGRWDGEQQQLAAECADADLGAEQRFTQSERQIHGKVGAIPGEYRVLGDADRDVEMAAALGLAGEADALTVRHTRRDPDLETLAGDLDVAFRA